MGNEDDEGRGRQDQPSELMDDGAHWVGPVSHPVGDGETLPASEAAGAQGEGGPAKSPSEGVGGPVPDEERPGSPGRATLGGLPQAGEDWVSAPRWSSPSSTMPWGGSGWSGPPRGGAFEWGPYGSGPPPPRRRRRVWPIALAGLILVAGAVGAGLGAAVGGKPGSGRPLSSGTLAGVNAGQLEVNRIAHQVEPALVDITSTLGYDSGSAAGTGMILTSSGEVLTNNHVIEGATSISVQIDGKGPSYAAKVVGTDPKADVALLQMQGASGLHTVSLGNSSTASVGEPVVAIGNALDLQGSPTVTDGTISALDRSITASDASGASPEHLKGLIQTDAPLAPGNSGGPLLDAKAQVVGMDTAAAAGSPTGSASNVGFAIPINTAMSVVDGIRSGSTAGGIQLGAGDRGFLGVLVCSVGYVQSATPGSQCWVGFAGFGQSVALPVSSGAVVIQVVPNSAAEKAGLQTGDVIVSCNSKAVTSPSALTKDLSPYKPDQKVTIGWVDSGGAQHQATVTLGHGPAA